MSYNRFMKKFFAASVLVCAAAVLFSGCSDTDGYSTENKTFYVMDASATLSITAKFDSEARGNFNALANEIDGALKAIESSVSAHVKTSCIYAFNEVAAGATVEIDETAYELLTVALSVYNLTGGSYNPAVYYSVYDYGFYGLYGFMTEENLPSDETVAKYVALSEHFGETELLNEDGKFYAKKPSATVEVGGKTLNMKIDLGGIGKGYAVDKVNALIDSYGFEYGNFNFASSSIAIKRHYSSGEYTLGFLDPRSGGMSTYINTKIKDKCVSTSGDYENYYELGGLRYCHIIDPKTGKPVRTGIMTATVLGGSAAEDDALTTAIMCMDREEAIAFIAENLSDRAVVFTYDNGKSYEFYTNIAKGDYTVVNKNYTAKAIAKG